MSSQQREAFQKRRRPQLNRRRPGSKRPRTVFNVDDIKTIAPPELPNKPLPTEPESERSEVIETDTNNDTAKTVPLENSTTESLSKVDGRKQQQSIGGKIIDTNVLEPPNTGRALDDRRDKSIEKDNQEKEQRSKTAASETLGDADGSSADDSSDSSDSDDFDKTNKGPWWTWPENQHKLEKWLMEKLDAIITTAERKEEEDFMNYFDEKILMHQLLQNIEQAEGRNRSNENTTDKSDSSSNNHGNNAQVIDMDIESKESTNEEISEKNFTEQEPKQSNPCATTADPMVLELQNQTAITDRKKADQRETQKRSKDPTAAISQTNECSPARMTKTKDVSSDSTTFTVIRRALPKTIPNQPADQVSLFTLEEFDNCVVKPLNNKWPNQPLGIKVFETFPGDIHSYLLEVRFPKNHGSSDELLKLSWQRLQAATQAYLRSKISRINLKCLLKDGASLELDLELSILEPLGISFSKFSLVRGEVEITDANQNDCPPGLWIKRVIPEKGLAKTLGSHENFQHGCALLAVDGTPISDPSVLQDILKAAKAKKDGRNHLNVKICLSKYSNLRTIPFSKLIDSYKLRRRDGKPLNPDEYPGLPSKAAASACTEVLRVASKEAGFPLPDESKEKDPIHSQVALSKETSDFAGNAKDKQENDDYHKSVYAVANRQSNDGDGSDMSMSSMSMSTDGRDKIKAKTAGDIEEDTGVKSSKISPSRIKPLARPVSNLDQTHSLERKKNDVPAGIGGPKTILSSQSDQIIGQKETLKKQTRDKNKVSEEYHRDPESNHKEVKEARHLSDLSEDEDTVRASFDPFCVDLNTMRPIGGYFITQRGKDCHSKCVLISKDPGGQIASDSRLNFGTKVMAVMVGGEKIEVYNHTELQAHYNDAKRHKKTLRLLVLSNTFSFIKSNGKWSTRGAWLGSDTSGWAGGAPSEHEKTPTQSTIIDYQDTRENKQQSLQHNNSSLQQRQHGQPHFAVGVEGLELLKSPTNSDKRQSKVLLQTRGSFSSREGSFSPGVMSHDEVQRSGHEASICEESFSPRRRSSSLSYTNVDKMRRYTASTLPGEEPFVDAVRNKSWKDLVGVLEKGPNFNTQFVQEVLERQYRYIDSELSKSNSRSSEEVKDLEAKKKILKLYINSTYLIEKATSLRYWTEISIEIKSIEFFHLSSESIPERSGVISTSVRTKISDYLCHLPIESKRSRIDYTSKNEFSIRNNYNISLDRRKVVVEVSEGDPKLDKIKPKKLGEFTLTLNEIEKQCPADGQWKDIEKRSETFGLVKFRAKRRRAKKEYVAQKRKDAIRLFGIQLETIERFNHEYGISNTFRLTPNIRGIHGIPLLYAAVEITAGLQIVEKLLSLGGDPRKPPERDSLATCTPLELAKKQYDRCEIKAREASKSSNPGASASAEKSAQAKRLLDLLEATKQ